MAGANPRAAMTTPPPLPSSALCPEKGVTPAKVPCLLNRQRSCSSFDLSAKKIDHVLTPEEKRFILLVERGDTASVAKTICAFRHRTQLFDINCVDPLGRSALSIAIINENPEMMEVLLNEGIMVKVFQKFIN